MTYTNAITQTHTFSALKWQKQAIIKQVFSNTRGMVSSYYHWVHHPEKKFAINDDLEYFYSTNDLRNAIDEQFKRVTKLRLSNEFTDYVYNYCTDHETETLLPFKSLSFSDYIDWFNSISAECGNANI